MSLGPSQEGHCRPATGTPGNDLVVKKYQATRYSLVMTRADDRHEYDKVADRCADEYDDGDE
jgi:hypothetical protein